MLKKFIKLLTNNLGLKVVSVLVAVMIWLVVMNLDNPDKTVSFVIPVMIEGQETLEGQGKVYEVYNDSDKATIYVTGKRAIMESLSASDFSATANLGNINLDSESDIKMVPITVTANRRANEVNINQKTMNLLVTIEDLSTERLPISGDTQGTPAEGYAIGEVSVSPNLINVSGPESLVSRIKRVSATVNVQGVSSNVSDSVVPILYDENDEVIQSPQLKLNQERVSVEVQILGTKEVPVRCLTTGDPADGYQFIEVVYAPERIWIKGVPSVLNRISEIVIPGEAIDLTGATGDVVNNIDMAPYVEGLGVMLRDPDENKIAVTAIVERLETKSYDLPVSAIEVLNLDENYELSFASSTVTVTVRGRGEELAALTAADLRASLDLAQVEPGDYSRELQVNVPDPFQLLRNIYVQIHVTDKNAEPEEGGATDPSGSVVPAGPGGVDSGSGSGDSGGTGGSGSGSGSNSGSGSGNSTGTGNSTGAGNNNNSND